MPSPLFVSKQREPSKVANASARAPDNKPRSRDSHPVRHRSQTRPFISSLTGKLAQRQAPFTQRAARANRYFFSRESLSDASSASPRSLAGNPSSPPPAASAGCSPASCSACFSRWRSMISTACASAACSSACATSRALFTILRISSTSNTASGTTINGKNSSGFVVAGHFKHGKNLGEVVLHARQVHLVQHDGAGVGAQPGFVHGAQKLGFVEALGKLVK